MLRAYFPVAPRAEFATCECAFGTISRPMTWSTPFDQARFEVPVHRFLDVSEHGYGIALMNNGRYGHAARDGIVSITLMPSPMFPDPHSDEGESEFTYALMPHAGDWYDGGVLAEAADLNAPMPAASCAGANPGCWQGLSVAGRPMALGALKLAERADGLVMRVYEPLGMNATVQCSPPQGARWAAELNVLEEPGGPPRFDFGPFQIRSWLLSPDRELSSQLSAAARGGTGPECHTAVQCRHRSVRACIRRRRPGQRLDLRYRALHR